MGVFIRSNRIRIYYLYVENNELNLIKSEDIELVNDMVIEKESLLNLIERNKVENKKRYSLKTIMKFNINAQDVYNSGEIVDDGSYLEKENYMRDIYFNNLSYIFEDINCLFIVLNRITTNKRINLTKKIYNKGKNNKDKNNKGKDKNNKGKDNKVNI